jgi:glycosyltransferase involved in cell wall biosynthesis
MKILHIYELGPSDPEGVCDGIGVALLELCRRLAERGHEVAILTGCGREGPRRRRGPEGVEIIETEFLGAMAASWSPVTLSLWRQLAFPFSLWRSLIFSPQSSSIHDYEIYHGHLYISGLIASGLARRNGGAVAVNTLHGSYYPVWRSLEDPLTAAAYRFFERVLAPLLARASDLQIHTAGYFADQVHAWGAAREKIRLIHNGVDLEVFREDGNGGEGEALAPLSSSPLLFTARRLVRKNGLHHLLRALPPVVEETGCRLLIAGEGPERARLEGLARALGIQESVEFLGPVSRSRMPLYLRRADVAVLPSLIEASSLFLLEAMAMGKAILATRTGGIPEILEEGEALLVEVGDIEAIGDGLLTLLRDGRLRERLGKRVRCRSREYSWERVVDETEEAYAALLRARGEEKR